MLFIVSTQAFYLTGMFAWLAVIITCDMIYNHLKFYTKPSQQIWIVRILFMVPIYSLLSWLSLAYYKYAIYFDVIRDCYEAFVIYSFLSLCFDFLGGEAEVLNKLKGRTFHKSMISCTCCFADFSYTHKFIRYCKRGTLQFCVVKPLMTILIVILELANSYSDGDFSPSTAYFWITMVYNVSITIALYALFLFYDATSDYLRPYHPVSKFICVKSVIFLSYWQGFVISGLVHAGAIADSEEDDVTAAQLASCYQNFIITIEMFLAAIAHVFAFSPTNYRKLRVETFTSTLDNFRQTINPKDIIADTVRNFSSQYENYAKQNQEEIPMDEIIEKEEDFEAKTDFKVTAFLGAKPRISSSREQYSLMSDDELFDSDH